MEAQITIALIVFLFPLAYSPGPGNAFFASIGASFGLRAALPALLGYHTATFVVTMLIGMGIGLVLLTEPHFARFLTIAGALYVFWLGYLFIKASRTADAGARQGAGPTKVGFVDGALILLFNPKAYYIIGLLFTQFLTSNGDRLGQVLNITTIFTINNMLAFVVWTLAGATIARLFKSEAANRRINIIFAICLFGVGVWIILPALSLTT